MSSSHSVFIFKVRTIRRRLVRFIREAWYKLVRARVQVLVWALWSRYDWISDHAISRRSAISQLGALTWIRVKPTDIETYVQPQDVDRKHFFWDGDWDLRVKKMRDHQRYQLMEDLWLHRNALQKSQTYRKLVRDLEQGIYPSHFNRNLVVDSPHKALALVESQCEIFESLQRHGYQESMATDEIKVAVDRDGNLIKANGGRKRLSAAIICNLPEIPVRVAYVHKAWVKKHTMPGSRNDAVLRRALETLHQTA